MSDDDIEIFYQMQINGKHLGQLDCRDVKNIIECLIQISLKKTLNKEVIEQEKILILHTYCRTALGIQHALELTKPIREWYLNHKK